MPLSQRFSACHFVAAALRSPSSVGSIMPSSRALSRAIAAQVDMSRPGTIVELGAGTGAVTRALLDAGASPSQLVVVELDEKLHALLQKRFPQLTVLRADAIELTRVLREAKPGRVNAVVSSLPLLTLPEPVRDGIADQIVQVMEKDTPLVQFTYGMRSSIDAKMQQRLGLSGYRARLVLANLPPAHVWVYRKAA